MEQIKSSLLEAGRKLAQSALTLVRATAEATANMMGRAAGHAVVFAREKGGELVKTAGGKAKAAAQDHRQVLLIAAAVVSGLALAASLAGLLLGRKK
jgi:hypothetical protein